MEAHIGQPRPLQHPVNCSAFRHVDYLLSQLPTLFDRVRLCPELLSLLSGEKAPRLLVDLHHPWAGSFFAGLFFVLRRSFCVAVCALAKEKLEYSHPQSKALAVFLVIVGEIL